MKTFTHYMQELAAAPLDTTSSDQNPNPKSKMRVRLNHVSKISHGQMTRSLNNQSTEPAELPPGPAEYKPTPAESKPRPGETKPRPGESKPRLR